MLGGKITEDQYRIGLPEKCKECGTEIKWKLDENKYWVGVCLFHHDTGHWKVLPEHLPPKFRALLETQLSLDL